ncbi:MAG: trypsin-like peptidase domain-containing protein [Candidatus Pacebacteria bacterium]|nr:trypsin-like peptidase domain-containing protein [Candidatus Paceibacterota bacterium]
MVEKKPRKKPIQSDNPKGMMGARGVASQPYLIKKRFKRITRLFALVVTSVLIFYGLLEFGDRLGLNLPWLRNHTVAQVSDRLVPAVVTITSQSRDALDPDEATALGSGVVIDSQGHIVTNYHVIARGSDFKVQFGQAEPVDAQLVGFDRLTDLAVLKVTVPQIAAYARFGRSRDLRVGDRVVTVGNPMGLGTTVTSGIVSARERRLGKGESSDYLQIDATINQGNSGGPLVNLKAQVVGINTAIIAGENGGWSGIGFSLGSDTVKPVVTEIIKNGRFRRGWQGVMVQSVSRSLVELPDRELLGQAQLMVVVGTVPASPAEVAGLRPGDLVLKLDGRSVTNEAEVQNLIRQAKIGEKLTWAIFRDGHRITIKVEVKELPDSAIGETNSDAG